ncbi:hypothetical protein TIFTF001_046681 [Ficus carica]|uniref:FAR1 domain-containing protein n=1 Tax=Ficus carica TaxID=3494 RepID=A0AA87ZTZ5_FICCA|nr:hypothetical protein TIFTF001_046672 [Ficus carica]GMN33155.1 hypothetical protein TIFTF001_046674 [Ficus carica]GMN33167.1 hypothetical protein TIFTF001_046677 [Ficus carica]GMN33185.1 hypothetical protein TIFTF001_046681 [Ficus carica]
MGKDKSCELLYKRELENCITKGERRKNAAGEASIRSWMCSREGFRLSKYINVVNRKKEPKGITRCGCKALFRINRLRKKDVWVVKEFQTEHCHELVPLGYKRFLRSARVVSGGVLETARAMKASGIQCCQIMSYLAFQLETMKTFHSRQRTCRIT